MGFRTVAGWVFLVFGIVLMCLWVIPAIAAMLPGSGEDITYLYAGGLLTFVGAFLLYGFPVRA